LGPGDGDGLGFGVGVGVGLGVFALTPPQPARNVINSRPRTSTLQAERDLFIQLSPPGESRLLLIRNAGKRSRLAALGEFRPVFSRVRKKILLR
jgi:hypothetical protein